MKPRVLIVNGDDFGLSPGVNAGIAEAFDRGILTSTTLLANAPSFDEAAELAQARAERGLGVGVHLNIVRGAPLSPPGEVSRLVDSSGRFIPFRMRRLTAGFLRQAAAEYRRQIQRVTDAGITPTHIDFEKHHAWQGMLYRVACAVAREAGIRAVRRLREPVLWSIRNLGWPGRKRALPAVLLRCGVDTLGGGGAEGLKYPDRLLGQCAIGGMNEEIWLSLLRALPSGASEVMTHPGCESGEDSGMGESWIDRGRSREIELAALTSPRVREAIRAEGIRPAHFGNFGELLRQG